ncbi:hypothetical protein [Actinomadura atramentaria]|uniref:hypothetical protein n=1 Tax=Actinomadura atramentaria TaxID=1990 RepID=UPI0003A076D9|nr:hypothetical protein [Actinomadura atramentaria]
MKDPLGGPTPEDAAVPVAAEWALFGHSPATQRQEVLACSAGRLGAADFAEIAGRYDPGTLETLPQVTLARAGSGDGAYLTVARQEWAAEDRYGRPQPGTRLFCVPYAALAARPVSYAALHDALNAGFDAASRREPSPRPAPGRRTGLSAGPPVSVPAGGALLRVSVPELSAAEIAADITAPAMTAAALLLTGRPVCLVPDAGLPLDARLRFLDAVVALLPYGMRTALSASTWTSATADHRIRLFFSRGGRPGAHTLALTGPPPDPFLDDAVDAYLEILRRAPNLPRVIRTLATSADPLPFLDAAPDALTRLTRAFPGHRPETPPRPTEDAARGGATPPGTASNTTRGLRLPSPRQADDPEQDPPNDQTGDRTRNPWPERTHRPPDTPARDHTDDRASTPPNDPTDDPTDRAGVPRLDPARRPENPPTNAADDPEDRPARGRPNDPARGATNGPASARTRDAGHDRARDRTDDADTPGSDRTRDAGRGRARDAAGRRADDPADGPEGRRIRGGGRGRADDPTDRPEGDRTHSAGRGRARDAAGRRADEPADDPESEWTRGAGRGRAGGAAGRQADEPTDDPEGDRTRSAEYDRARDAAGRPADEPADDPEGGRTRGRGRGRAGDAVGGSERASAGGAAGDSLGTRAGAARDRADEPAGDPEGGRARGAGRGRARGAAGRRADEPAPGAAGYQTGDPTGDPALGPAGDPAGGRSGGSAGAAAGARAGGSGRGQSGEAGDATGVLAACADALDRHRMHELGPVLPELRRLADERHGRAARERHRAIVESRGLLRVQASVPALQRTMLYDAALRLSYGPALLGADVLHVVDRAVDPDPELLMVLVGLAVPDPALALLLGDLPGAADARGGLLARVRTADLVGWIAHNPVDAADTDRLLAAVEARAGDPGLSAALPAHGYLAAAVAARFPDDQAAQEAALRRLLRAAFGRPALTPAERDGVLASPAARDHPPLRDAARSLTRPRTAPPRRSAQDNPAAPPHRPARGGTDTPPGRTTQSTDAPTRRSTQDHGNAPPHRTAPGSTNPPTHRTGPDGDDSPTRRTAQGGTDAPTRRSTHRRDDAPPHRPGPGSTDPSTQRAEPGGDPPTRRTAQGRADAPTRRSAQGRDSAPPRRTGPGGDDFPTRRTGPDGGDAPARRAGMGGGGAGRSGGESSEGEAPGAASGRGRAPGEPEYTTSDLVLGCTAFAVVVLLVVVALVWWLVA